MTIIIAQILSIINGVFLLLSMRCKNKEKFLTLNSLSNAFGFASMIVLGAYSAAVGPIVLTIQGITSYFYEKKEKIQPKWMKGMYILLSILGGALTINSILSILPVLSSIFASLMLMSKDMRTSRKIGLISSSIALPYLIINKAYVAAFVFTSSFINTVDAIYKLDIKKEKIIEPKITELNIIEENHNIKEKEHIENNTLNYSNEKNKVLVKKRKKI